MRFTFLVEVEVTRITGKFISGDDLAEQIREALDGANPNEIDVDESNYEVTDWTVSEQTRKGSTS
jgi:hypothetical protein